MSTIIERKAIKPKNDWHIGSVRWKRAQKQTYNIFENDMTKLVLQMTGKGTKPFHKWYLDD